jgi:hypothetical protein
MADTQMSFCSGAKGQPRRLNAASKTAKVDLEAALKASFDECDSVLDSTTDATATQRKTLTANRQHLAHV